MIWLILIKIVKKLFWNFFSNKGIPALGKHYALQWAEEDLNQQVKEGSRLSDYEAFNDPSRSSKEQKFSVVSPLLEDSIQKCNSLNQNSKNAKQNQPKDNESLNYGPLTQRLISALIEQNLMTPLDNEIADYLDKIGPPPQPMYMSPKTMAQKLNFNSTNASTLEKKIKKTLIEQSILDIDENDNLSDENSVENATADSLDKIDKDDEIANEIKLLQNELKVVTKQCKQTLGNLLETSKQSILRQDLKKKISQLDSEVNYERMSRYLFWFTYSVFIRYLTSIRNARRHVRWKSLYLKKIERKLKK